MEHNEKFYLVNIDYTFNEGDRIIFEMPSFCSGDYDAEVMKDDKGLFIPKKDNFFNGCRDFDVITNIK